MFPAELAAVSSTRFARPPHTFVTVVVPSYSTQVVEPVSGRANRRRWVFHVPISKSKSCWPSRDGFVDLEGDVVFCVAVCAHPRCGASVAISAHPASQVLTTRLIVSVA